jgi:hypothetical protein
VRVTASTETTPTPASAPDASPSGLAAARSRLPRFLRAHTLAFVAGWFVAFAIAFVALLALTDHGVGAPPRQLVTNPSFESRIPPWEPYKHGRLERSTRAARFGTASAAASSVDLGSYGLYWIGAVVAPAPGDRFRFSAWVKGTGAAIGNRVTLQLIEHGGPHEDRVIASSTAVLAKSWRRLGATGSVEDDGRATLDSTVYVETPRRDGETAYIDGLSLLELPATGRSS